MFCPLTSPHHTHTPASDIGTEYAFSTCDEQITKKKIEEANPKRKEAD